jgi:hypothetical protein
MLYVVSLKQTEVFKEACTLGVFLMKEDAEMFMNKHRISNELIVLDVVDGVWNKWQDIRTELETQKETA